MRGLILVTAMLVISTATSLPATTEASDVVQCTDVLETLYGVSFSGCVPDVSASTDCFGYSGTWVICATASATVTYDGDAPLSAICPDRIGEEQPAMQSCWTYAGSGSGWAVLSGTVTTEGDWGKMDVCLHDALESCTTDLGSTPLGRNVVMDTQCGSVVTESWMVGGMTWPAADNHCGKK